MGRSKMKFSFNTFCKLTLILFFFSTSLILSKGNLKQKPANVAVEIETIAIDSSGNLFAGTTRTGIYRSSDWGKSWSQVLFWDKVITSLIVTPNNTIFVATMDSGVYRSTDGNNWTQAGFSNTSFGVLTTNSVGDIFAAINDEGLYRSVDNGNHWQQIYSDGSLVKIIDYDGDIFGISEHISKDEFFVDILRVSENGVSASDLVIDELDDSGISDIGISARDNLYCVVHDPKNVNGGIYCFYK